MLTHLLSNIMRGRARSAVHSATIHTLCVLISLLIFSADSFAQIPQLKVTKLAVTDSLKVEGQNVTSFFTTLSDSNTTNTSTYGDSTISQQKLTQSLIDVINAAGGGSITNNPDEVTITVSGGLLGVKASSLTTSFLDGSHTFDFASGLTSTDIGVNTSSPQSLVDIQGNAGAAGILTLATKELTVVDGDELGRINFNAPLESSGSNSIIVGASIWGEADLDFSPTNNNTEIVFATAETGAVAERMRITADGNVGIGETSPSQLLEVAGTNVVAHFDATQGASLWIDRGATTRSADIRFLTAETPDWYIGLPDSDISGDGTEFSISTSAGGSSPALWIETNGNVGIDTNSPNAKLQVAGVVNIDGFDTGNFVADEYDLRLGSTTNDSAAVMRIGNLEFGTSDDRTLGASLTAGGTVFFGVQNAPDGIGEFIFTEAGGDIRMAIPIAGASYGTANLRSGIYAGPSVMKDSIMIGSYWGFNRLAMDTGNKGADLGVQNNVQIGDSLYVDTAILIGGKQFTTQGDSTLIKPDLIYTTGNIGVGTVSPEALLEVQGAEGTDAELILDADDGDDNADTWTFRSAASDNDLNILNHSTIFVTIDATGEMGIGTSDPNWELDVEGSSAGININNTISNATGAVLQFEKKRISGAVADDDELGVIEGWGFDSVTFTQGTYINFEVDAAAGSGDVPGRIVFGTRIDGGALTEKMRIDNAGLVGVGTAAPAHLLHLSGGNIALGDTTTGDVDAIIYFADDGSVTAEDFRWDDGDGRFEFTDDIWTALTIEGEHLASTDDADIVDNLTAGDIVIDETAGVLDFSGATSATIITSGSNIDLTLTPNGTGNIVMSDMVVSATATQSVVGPTNNVSVAGINVLFIDTNGNNVTIGGFVGGVSGQVLEVVVIDATNNAILEYDEDGGSQDIFTNSGADETLTASFGGWTLICDGTAWFEGGGQ